MVSNRRVFVKVKKATGWALGELLGFQNGELCVRIIKHTKNWAYLDGVTFHVFTDWEKIEYLDIKEASIEVL